MRPLSSKSVSGRMKRALPALAALASLGAFTLCGCGWGVSSTASTGVPASALNASSAPRLGYAWDELDATLRPIAGIPGSSQFGESVTPAGAYSFGIADPGGTYALLLGGSQNIYRMSLPGGSPVALPWQAPNTAKIRMSPQGTAALVFVPGATSGTLLTQLSGTPAGKAVTFAGPVIDGAVNDSGNFAVACTASGGATVQVTPASGQTSAVANVQSYGGMSFISGTDDLLVADAAANSLSRIRSASTHPSTATVPTNGLLKAPVSVSASRAARWAVIANGAEGSVVRVDLSGATPAQSSTCNCQPSMVSQLATDSAFRLTTLKDGPVWISDASVPAFPVLFIPAVASESTAAAK